MTPGPTRIPERIARAGMRGLHHRTPEFSAALGECLARLRPLFGTAAADILPVHATGRAAMEGAIVNFFSPGDTLIACCNGRFGEIWAGLAEVYGLEVVRVATDWDSNVDPDEVASACASHPGARAVTVVHSDTSTGGLNPVADVAEAARAHGALTLVDAISSLAGRPFAFDAWDLDFAVTSSQKCLMSSPGIAFAVVGPRLWAAGEGRGMPRAYLDFGSVRGSLSGEAPETPGTTPVMLVMQVLEAVRMIHEEGLARVFGRHAAMAERLRLGAADLGFGLQGPGIDRRSETLTALTVPPGVDPHALRAAVRARGIQIAVGLGAYRESCVRVGHMGDIRMADVERTLEVLEAALPDASLG